MARIYFTKNRKTDYVCNQLARNYVFPLNYKLILSIVLLVLINCSNLKIFQETLYINPNIVPDVYVNRTESGEYDYKQIETNLKKYLNEFTVLIKDHESRYWHNKIKFNINDSELVIKLKKTQRNEIIKRVKEKINADIPFANLFIKVNFYNEYVNEMELELNRKNPYYELEYMIKPKKLLDLHFNSKKDGGISFVIFTKKIFAPELFVIRKSEILNSLFVFLQKHINYSFKKKTRINSYFSNEFIVREFAKPELVERLNNYSLSCIHNKTGKKIYDYSGMFIWEEKLKDFAIDKGAFAYAPSNKKKIYSPSELVITIADKSNKRVIDKYRLNPFYAQHLEAEGVTFDCSKPEYCNFEAEGIKGSKYVPQCKDSYQEQAP